MKNINIAMGSADLQVRSLPIQDLKIYSDRLATESSLGVDIISTFKSILPSFSVTLSEKIGTLSEAMFTANKMEYEGKEQDIDTVLVKQLQDDYLTKEPMFSYTYMSQKLVSIPENFKGDLFEYLTFMLSKSSTDSDIFAVTFKLLDEYRALLSEFLTNKDVRLASDVNRRIIDDAQSLVEDTRKEHQKFFLANTGKSKARLGVIAQRMADVKSSFSVTSGLIIAYRNAPVQKIHDEVNKCSAMLKMVCERVDDGDIINVSPAVARKLSDSAMALAQLVEYVAVHRFAMNVVITSTVKMYKELADYMK